MSKDIASRTSRTLWGIKLPDRVRYLNGNRFDDQLYRHKSTDIPSITDSTVTITKIFENNSYLAINHWVGLVRITYHNGDYIQFIVDTAASVDTVVAKIKDEIFNELEESDFNISKNTVNLETDFPVKRKQL